MTHSTISVLNLMDVFPQNTKRIHSPQVSNILSLYGSNLKDQDRQESQACLSAGQVMVFNMKKSGTNERHHLDREPLLPIYIGLNIHQQTRCRKLITQFYHMGISISYDRVLGLEDRIATSLCEQYEEDGVVSPVCLKKGLFTVGAIDNLDYNPYSTTS